MTQPNAGQYAAAIRELSRAGIHGSDARTAFAGACLLADIHDYRQWLDSISDLTFTECFDHYGNDSGRAVWALGHPTPTQT